MRKYISSIVLSIIILGGISLMPLIIDQVKYSYLILSFIFIFFLAPFLTVSKSDNLKIQIIKYSIVVLPFFIIYGIVLFMVKNMSAVPIWIMIIMSGACSFLALNKGIYIKAISFILLLLFGYYVYPNINTEIIYRNNLKNSQIEGELFEELEKHFDFNMNKNELLILDFWTSTCGNSIKTFPEFQKFYTDNKDKYNIYSVNIPLERDVELNFNPEQFLKDRRYTFPLRVMSSSSAERLGVSYLPVAVVINGRGIIKYKGKIRYEIDNSSSSNFETILEKLKHD